MSNDKSIRRFGNRVIVVIMAMLAMRVASTCVADESPTIDSIDALWAGFDPRAVPLDVEVIDRTDEGDVHVETIYFTGEEHQSEKTRIFGYYGRPLHPVGKLPGILHIHGGGQTANRDWVRFWAKRGYCALSFDFCGDTNLPHLGPEYRRTHFTRWGKIPADMMKVGGGRQMEPSPRDNPWFHWTIAARRGLTLLESRAEVDGQRLGIFGISVGGTLTWIVAAVDPRVKAAAPIYGCGWESYHEFPPQPDAPVDRATQLWRTLIAPEAHAPRIRCPVFFFSATNDFHGRMDSAFETLDRLPSDVLRGQVFTANYDHHVEPLEGRSLPLWMGHHLQGAGTAWPRTPQLQVSLGGTTPELRVEPDAASEVERVDVYYALNNNWPMTRFWRSASATRDEQGRFVAPAPVTSADDVIHALANVTYRSSIRVSSRLVIRSVKDLPGVRPSLARSALIDTMESAADWNWVPAYTDPNQDDIPFFASWQGPDNERGFTLDPRRFDHRQPMHFYFGTRKIGDPQFGAAADTPTLLIDTLAANLPQALTIRLKHRLPNTHARDFEATWNPPANDPATTATSPWHTLRLSRTHFHTPAGEELPDWRHVEYFILDGTAAANHPPVFKRLRWAE